MGVVRDDARDGAYVGAARRVVRRARGVVAQTAATRTRRRVQAGPSRTPVVWGVQGARAKSRAPGRRRRGDVCERRHVRLRGELVRTHGRNRDYELFSRGDG